jgi:hypothetical protein
LREASSLGERGGSSVDFGAEDGGCLEKRIRIFLFLAKTMFLE